MKIKFPFLKLKSLYRRFFGIRQFNKSEVDDLIKLYNENNLDMYSFRIFQRARKLAKGKYDLITEDFFYNNLSAKVADGFAKKNSVLKTRHDYVNMILGDFITIDITLQTIAEAFDGYTIGSR